MTRRKPLLLLAMLLATSATGLAIAAAPAGPTPAPVRMDSNGDGVIDRQEAAAHPRLAQRFDELDKNKDGKLARDEMPAPRHGMRHDRHHGGMRGGRDGGFMTRGMDADNDGRISAAEYRAQFDRLDVNKDGYIDRADRQARAEQRRAEWFAKADTDKDGKLSQAELEAARSKNGPRGSHGPRTPMVPLTPAAK
ncbi:EF-hand domain-containing protein [Stenotrophomonas sp. Iso1]|uniref:EF-hand domain-containing protein n=1 Tax=Stenotrophomonas sp. Iso1 TaxID=2977283 RepID=UPI0022B7D608|nr:EF-hand domain-containing protein [Stenotrophomonas sp. Iso1]